MCTIFDVLSHFMLFCCKILIYAILSRYLFCRDLRAFAWRKIQPRIAPVEKKWLISGMRPLCVLSLLFASICVALHTWTHKVAGRTYKCTQSASMLTKWQTYISHQSASMQVYRKWSESTQSGWRAFWWGWGCEPQWPTPRLPFALIFGHQPRSTLLQTIVLLSQRNTLVTRTPF